MITRYDPDRVQKAEMMSIADVQEILSLELLGVIPESKSVLNASNSGVPVILDRESEAGQAYADVVKRYLGERVPHRFIENKKNLLKRWFGD